MNQEIKTKKSGINIENLVDYKEFVDKLSQIKEIELRDGNKIEIVKFLDHHSQKPEFMVNNPHAPQILWHELKSYYLVTKDLNIIRVNVEIYGGGKNRKRFLNITHMGTKGNSFRINPVRLLNAMDITIEETEEQDFETHATSNNI